MRIGVDVGGTNTDAVLLSGKKVLGAVKRPTSGDVSSGISDAIGALISECGIKPDAISAVMIGTTHFTNAFIQRRELVPVYAVRIGFPASRGIPPFSSWPEDLKAVVCGGSAMIAGATRWPRAMQRGGPFWVMPLKSAITTLSRPGPPARRQAAP